MADPLGAEGIVLRRAALLRRYENGLDRDVQRIISQAFDRLEQLLLRQDPTAVSQGWQARRIQSLTKRADAIVADAYRDILKATASELRALGVLAGEATAAETVALAAAAGVAIAPLRLPSRNLLRAIAATDPIQGATLREWWSQQAGRTQNVFRRELQIGLTRRETIDQIVRRIRGRVIRTQGGGRVLQGGLLQLSRREATVAVRTAVNEVYNRAAALTLQENADLVWGLEWVATLDERTCIECALLDGKVWKMDDPALQIPPRHPNDRCTLISVFIPNKPRRRTTYAKWFAEQPEARQRRILGPGRLALLKGGASFTDLVNRDGRTLTLDELGAALR